MGAEVVRGLETEGIAVRAASRKPDEQRTGASTTRWVKFDFDDPSSFDSAVSGVDTVFLMARPGDERPEAAAIPLLEVLLSNGVKRIVNLTAMGCEMRPNFGLRKVELAIEGSGLLFTHLRPNFFMQIFCSGPHFAQLGRLRQLRLPAADAPISFIDSRDVAAIAVRCIVESGHAGRAYTLTGAEGLSHAAVTQIISRVSGIQLGYVPLSDDEARLEFAAAGLPTENVERLIGFYRIVKTGLAGVVSQDTAHLLGCAPRRFTDFATDYAERWRFAQA